MKPIKNINQALIDRIESLQSECEEYGCLNTEDALPLLEDLRIFLKTKTTVDRKKWNNLACQLDDVQTVGRPYISSYTMETLLGLSRARMLDEIPEALDNIDDVISSLAKTALEQQLKLERQLYKSEETN